MHPGIVEKKIEICKQEVKMPPSLLFLDEDLGSLHGSKKMVLVNGLSYHFSRITAVQIGQ
jgi:hypothetical protein